MSFIEFQEKNVKTAVEKACEELSLKQKEFKYDIISNGSSGIFGLVGVKKAKIRVYLSDDQEKLLKNRKEDEKQKSRSGLGSSANSSIAVQSLVDEAFNGIGQSDDSGKLKKEKPETSTEEPTEDVDENLEAGRKILQQIVDLITEGASVTIDRTSERVMFNINGGNAGLIIGKRGQNLDAIQYIIDKVVNKKNSKRLRIQVDVSGYIKKRKESLVRLAERLSEKSKRTGKASRIGMMNAQDRRTIHIALRNKKNIRTQSIGEGYYRKMIIIPKKTNYKKKHVENAEQSQ